MRHLITTAATIVAVLFMANERVEAQVADPLACTGYPEQRVFLESQGWWKDSTIAEMEGRHIHLGTCFPLHQQVRGIVHFDVRIMLHNMANWGAINLLRVQIFNNGSSSQFTTSIPLKLTCPTDDCQWLRPIDVDTTRVPYDGPWEFRMTANIPKTAQGHRFYQSTRWHAILANGKPVKIGTNATRSPGAAGWYTGADYTNVYCGIGDSGYKFVSTPQSGVVALTCKFDRQTAFASLDPAFHSEPPSEGVVLLNDLTGGTKTITVDTSMLSDGRHNLFLRTSTTVTKPPGTASGVLVLPFTVSNGAQSSIPIAQSSTPPVAANDAYAIDANSPFNVAAPGVLANDSDADGDALSAVLTSEPANGSLSLNPDGSFIYTPNVDFNGTDSFIYGASDGLATSTPATVTISVNPVP